LWIDPLRRWPSRDPIAYLGRYLVVMTSCRSNLFRGHGALDNQDQGIRERWSRPDRPSTGHFALRSRQVVKSAPPRRYLALDTYPLQACHNPTEFAILRTMLVKFPSRRSLLFLSPRLRAYFESALRPASTSRPIHRLRLLWYGWASERRGGGIGAVLPYMRRQRSAASASSEPA